MHDLQHDFVRLAATDLAGLHGRLVDAWRAAIEADRTRSVHPGDVWAGAPRVARVPVALPHISLRSSRTSRRARTSAHERGVVVRASHAVQSACGPRRFSCRCREYRACARSGMRSSCPRTSWRRTHMRSWGNCEGACWARVTRPCNPFLRVRHPIAPGTFFRPLNRCLTAPGDRCSRPSKGTPGE